MGEIDNWVDNWVDKFKGHDWVVIQSDLKDYFNVVDDVADRIKCKRCNVSAIIGLIPPPEAGRPLKIFGKNFYHYEGAWPVNLSPFHLDCAELSLRNALE
jgi:hypothetical protein